MGEELLMLSNGKVGRQAEDQDWYATQHLANVKRIPGVADGTLYSLAKPEAAARWNIMARYAVSGTAEAALLAIYDRVLGGKLPMTDAIENTSVLMLTTTPIGSRVLAAQAEERSDATIFVVLTNATEDCDHAFNDWYSNQHLSDVLDVPGFIAAQRFGVALETGGKPSPWRYLALYEIVPETLDASIAQLRARAGGERMPISPTLASDVYTALFAPVAWHEPRRSSYRSPKRP